MVKKDPAPPLEAVREVDLKKYSGIWYDYAHTPQRFLTGCSDIKAEYKLEKPRYVSVYNSCTKKSGSKSSIRGKAFPVKGSNYSRLKVQFFWPFRADYWILYLDEDYKYALVGGPSRDYLWILTRNPKIEKKKYEELVKRAKEMGFDVDQLIRTVHNE